MRLAALLCALAMPAAAEIVAAEYAEPTTRYAHGVLGDAVEWGALAMRDADGRRLVVRLPESRVFEDTAPRVADVDGDGDAEVVVVESDLARGARLSIYDENGLVAANDFIGQPNRWLAPAGIADLDGDGRVEIAYVDRPHLAKRLLIWEVAGGALRQTDTVEDVTNHRIGDREIAGGVRDCGAGPELVLLSADWSRVVAVAYPDLTPRDLGANTGARLSDTLDCR